MKNILKPTSFACMLALFATAPAAFAQADNAKTSAPAPALKQYIYVLRPMPAYKNEAAWTKEVNAVVGRHFNYLKDLTSKGVVVLAGRTTYAADHESLFGIVVFEAADEARARAIMENDPAVQNKIMSAELHPYAVALQREQN